MSPWTVELACAMLPLSAHRGRPTRCIPEHDPNMLCQQYSIRSRTHFQARRARNNDNREIVARMQKLCTQLKTSTTWDEQEERLEIPMNRGVVPTTWNTRS